MGIPGVPEGILMDPHIDPHEDLSRAPPSGIIHGGP